jgi:hypothetical protein
MSNHSQVLVARFTTLCVVVGGAWLVSACGSSKAKSVDVGAGAGADASAGCTKDSCPPAEPDYSATVAPSGELIGFLNEPVAWTLYGVDRKTMTDQQTSSRRVVVLLNKIPQGATVTPWREDELKPQVTFTWTPTVQATGTMDVILRDYDRCIADEGEDECNSYVLKEEFDVQLAANLAWRVVDRAQVQAAQNASGGSTLPGGTGGTVVNVSNPNCGPNPTTDQQIQGQLMGKLLPVLTNPNAIVPTLMSTMIGGLTSGSQPAANPTEC